MFDYSTPANPPIEWQDNHGFNPALAVG